MSTCIRIDLSSDEYTELLKRSKISILHYIDPQPHVDWFETGEDFYIFTRSVEKFKTGNVLIECTPDLNETIVLNPHGSVDDIVALRPPGRSEILCKCDVSDILQFSLDNIQAHGLDVNMSKYIKPKHIAYLRCYGVPQYFWLNQYHLI